MSKYTQANRFMELSTPLGEDALLIETLSGVEALSEPFQFRLELLAEEPIDFNQLLGQPAGIRLELPNGTQRALHGILCEIHEGGTVAGPSGKDTFIRYRAELVPELWLLKLRVQSRVFQHQSVPDILKRVLRDDWQLAVSFQIVGSWEPRNFCVQYQESDFAFVSRLMEEEGISYRFAHSDTGHELILTNMVTGNESAQGNDISFEKAVGGSRQEARIRSWEKVQSLRACKHTLRDFCFEMPNHRLEAQNTFHDRLTVGKVGHQVNHQRVVNGTEMLEIYDHGGGFAHRFDGIDRHGQVRADELTKVFDDASRTARIRTEEAVSQGLRLRGTSDCAHFIPGQGFSLRGHFNADGPYVLTRVEHAASLKDAYTTGAEVELSYENRFECVPRELPYRPLRVTPRPRIEGTQTATVVGMLGTERGSVFTDKYGRVKVRFSWQRSAQEQSDSSCWVRVAQAWAGKGFGAQQIPRVGQEVIVDFLDGDPDRPIVVGCVYNAEQVPPFGLPESALVSGLRSRSHRSDNPEQANELRMDDTPGKERLHLQAEKDRSDVVENDWDIKVGHDQTLDVKNDSTATIHGNSKLNFGDGPISVHWTIGWNALEMEKLTKSVVVGTVYSEASPTRLEMHPLAKVELIGFKADVALKRYEKTKGNKTESVGGDKTESVGGDKTESVGGDKVESVGGNKADRITDSRQSVIGGGDSIICNGQAAYMFGYLPEEGQRPIRPDRPGQFTLTVNGAIQMAAEADISLGASADVRITANKQFMATNQRGSGYVLLDQDGFLYLGGTRIYLGSDDIQVVPAGDLNSIVQARLSHQANQEAIRTGKPAIDVANHLRRKLHLPNNAASAAEIARIMALAGM